MLLYFSFLIKHVSSMSTWNYLHPPEAICIEWIVLKIMYLLFWLWKGGWYSTQFWLQKSNVARYCNILLNKYLGYCFRHQKADCKVKLKKPKQICKPETKFHTPNTQLQICIWQLLNWLIHKKLHFSFLSYG